MGQGDNRITALLERHRAFWQRDRVERPLVTVRRYEPLAPKAFPLAEGRQAEEPVLLHPGMLDARAIAGYRQQRGGPGSLQTGDTLSLRAASPWIPWVEAIVGCPIRAVPASGSVWTEPFLQAPPDGSRLSLTPDNAWYRKLLECTGVLVEDGDGSYLATLSGLRGPIDIARAMLGDEAMCLAIHDSPGQMRSLLGAVTGILAEVARGELGVIPPFQGGYCTFGIWAPGTVVYTQADCAALLSARTYAELVLPFEQMLCRQFDRSIIHLHSGYLHTVDVLLDAEYPTAIEIWLDTGYTPATVRDLVPIFRGILERKPLILDGLMTAADLRYVLDSLPPHGLCVRADMEEAERACFEHSSTVSH